MAKRNAAAATLLEVLCDGFEKNEVLRGFHERTLPLPDEATAIARFEVFVEEATRWKGNPLEEMRDNGRRLVRWDDLEIRQAGRGVLVNVRYGRFPDWWHEDSTWAGEPMQSIYAWLDEEDARKIR